MSLTLLDWRRSVTSMYAEVRARTEEDPKETLLRFREAKNRLFREHHDSPILTDERPDFAGLPYWPYDPSTACAALPYLLDTLKGGGPGGLVLDFNYAYHPSCVFDPVWSCPLAPRAHWVEAPVRAGEWLA